MLDPPHAIRMMRALRDAGMRIAIDDFGTGFSSLAYLNRFPVSSLKIDRSFVKDMAKNKDDATIVRTIIEMAHSLSFTVVAEGVETEEQATFLRLLRCEQAQGYLFAKPMPREEFVKLLSAHEETSAGVGAGLGRIGICAVRLSEQAGPAGGELRRRRDLRCAGTRLRFLSRQLGQQVIVDNKPGAGTSIAGDFIAQPRRMDTPSGCRTSPPTRSTSISIASCRTTRSRTSPTSRWWPPRRSCWSCIHRRRPAQRGAGCSRRIRQVFLRLIGDRHHRPSGLGNAEADGRGRRAARSLQGQQPGDDRDPRRRGDVRVLHHAAGDLERQSQ